jgi:hypothetical protein
LPLFSQTYNGRILGNITDQTGAWVTGATVTIIDAQRGTTRTLTTDASGLYVAPELSPGMYTVRVEAKGFKTVQRINIPVEVAKDVRVDLTLQTGQVSEVVEVSGEVPLLDTTSSTLGGTISNVEINDLPLNGRNYENLLQIRPGVMRYPGGGFSTTSANGLRAEDNAYLIEGLYNSEPYSGQAIINGAGIAGDSATILPIDSVQEFNVQQNPPAEYGWKPGAVVNVGLKSGTNALHGTAFAFGRDGVMDARNYFNCAANPCAFSRAVRRQPGWPDHQEQGIFLWRLRRSALQRGQLLRRSDQSIHGFDAHERYVCLSNYGRLRGQHSECDCRLGSREGTWGCGSADQPDEPENRGLRLVRDRRDLQRDWIPTQQ